MCTLFALGVLVLCAHGLLHGARSAYGQSDAGPDDHTL
jgi:hypothetical protein